MHVIDTSNKKYRAKACWPYALHPFTPMHISALMYPILLAVSYFSMISVKEQVFKTLAERRIACMSAL